MFSRHLKYLLMLCLVLSSSAYAVCNTDGNNNTFRCTGNTTNSNLLGTGTINGSGIGYDLTGTRLVRNQGRIYTTFPFDGADGIRVGTSRPNGDLTIINEAGASIEGTLTGSFSSAALQSASGGANNLNIIINNSGEMSSVRDDALIVSNSGNFTLTNNAGGTITKGSSGTYSLQTSTNQRSGLRAFDNVTNAGTMTGDLLLRAQSVTFNNNAGGLVTGNVRTSQGTTTSVTSFTNAAGATITGFVLTGSQGDTVVNNGVISGTLTTGDGNDNVTIGGTTGAISLGTGADTLTINNGHGAAVDCGADDDTVIVNVAGGHSFTGATFNGGTGVNTITFNGSGTVELGDQGLQNFNTVTIADGLNFRLGGTHNLGQTFTIPQNSTMTLLPGHSITTTGNTLVVNGTLEAPGTNIIKTNGVTIGSTGNLKLEINSDTKTVPSALIVTGGIVTLGGTLTVTDVGAGTSYARGDRFVIITSDTGVGGTFANTVLPTLPSGAFQFNLFNDGLKVTLVIEAQASCLDSDLSINSHAVCRAINQAVLTESSTGNCQSIIDNLRTLTGGPLHEALLQLSPEGYGFVMDSNMISQQSFLANFEASPSSRKAIYKNGKVTAWIDLLHNQLHKEDSFEFNELKNRRDGIILGGDYRPRPGQLVRVGGGYTSQELKIPSNFKDEADNAHLLLLGKQNLKGNHYIQASASYDQGYHKTERYYSCLAFHRIAQSTFHSFSLAGRLEIGSELERFGISWNPWWSLSHQRFISMHRPETGSGDGDLSVQPMNQRAMLSQIGLRASTDIPLFGFGTLRPHIQASHRKELKRMGNRVEAKILGIPFEVETLGNQTSNEVGGGLQFQLRNNTMIHAGYHYREVDNSIKEHQAMIGGKIWM